MPQPRYIRQWEKQTAYALWIVLDGGCSPAIMEAVQAYPVPERHASGRSGCYWIPSWNRCAFLGSHSAGSQLFETEAEAVEAHIAQLEAGIARLRERLDMAVARRPEAPNEREDWLAWMRRQWAEDGEP